MASKLFNKLSLEIRSLSNKDIKINISQFLLKQSLYSLNELWKKLDVNGFLIIG